MNGKLSIASIRPSEEPYIKDQAMGVMKIQAEMAFAEGTRTYDERVVFVHLAAFLQVDTLQQFCIAIVWKINENHSFIHDLN
jgi:hypothetical protein